MSSQGPKAAQTQSRVSFESAGAANSQSLQQHCSGEWLSAAQALGRSSPVALPQPEARCWCLGHADGHCTEPSSPRHQCPGLGSAGPCLAGCPQHTSLPLRMVAHHKHHTHPLSGGALGQQDSAVQRAERSPGGEAICKSAAASSVSDPDLVLHQAITASSCQEGMCTKSPNLVS